MKKTPRRLFIEPYRQLRFGIMFLGLNFVFSCAILGVFAYYLLDIYGAIVEYFKLDPLESGMTLSKLGVPFGVAAALILVFIGLTLYFSAYYTHQIYGPLVSIRRFLDQVLRGESPAPIQLRKKDQLHDLVGRLNGLARQLEQKTDSIESVNQYIESMIHGEEPMALPVLPTTDPLHTVVAQLERLKKALPRSR